MAAAVYLEQYLDSLESLPLELQRNFSLMRDLDRRAQEYLKETEKQADTFLASVNKMNQEEKKRKHIKMEQLFAKLTEYGDGKVQLAFQTYEMVDKHIRKLDNDLARFEAELNDKNLPVENSNPRPEKGASKRSRKKKDTEETQASKGTKRKKKEVAKEPSAVLQPPSPDLNAQPSDVLDMPVDPNEPTYCICHQVSYGEMIGCDNLDCPIEWFHFQCVNLTSKPKGKWYCPRCTEQRRKR